MARNKLIVKHLPSIENGRKSSGNITKYVLMGHRLELREHVQHGWGWRFYRFCPRRFC
jgi:hypothetical protein